MRNFFLLVFGCLVLTACNKEEKLWTGQYRVVQLSGTEANYTVFYTGENGVTHTLGNQTGTWWQSEEIANLKTDDLLRLRIELRSGSGRFDLRINVNGSPIAQDTLASSVANIEVAGSIVDRSGEL